MVPAYMLNTLFMTANKETKVDNLKFDGNIHDPHIPVFALILVVSPVLIIFVITISSSEWRQSALPPLREHV